MKRLKEFLQQLERLIQQEVDLAAKSRQEHGFDMLPRITKD